MKALETLRTEHAFDLNIVKSKGYSFFMETIYRLNKHGVDINEIPIHFRNRRHGSSKIPGIEIFRTLKNLFLLQIRSQIHWQSQLLQQQVRPRHQLY